MTWPPYQDSPLVLYDLDLLTVWTSNVSPFPIFPEDGGGFSLRRLVGFCIIWGHRKCQNCVWVLVLGKWASNSVTVLQCYTISVTVLQCCNNSTLNKMHPIHTKYSPTPVQLIITLSIDPYRSLYPSSYYHVQLCYRCHTHRFIPISFANRQYSLIKTQERCWLL